MAQVEDSLKSIGKLIGLNFARNSETGRYQKGQPVGEYLPQLAKINEQLVKITKLLEQGLDISKKLAESPINKELQATLKVLEKPVKEADKRPSDPLKYVPSETIGTVGKGVAQAGAIANPTVVIGVLSQATSAIVSASSAVATFTGNIIGAAGAANSFIGLTGGLSGALSVVVPALGVFGLAVAGLEILFKDKKKSPKETQESVNTKLDEQIKGTEGTFESLRSSTKEIGTAFKGLALSGDLSGFKKFQLGGEKETGLRIANLSELANPITLRLDKLIVLLGGQTPKEGSSNAFGVLFGLVKRSIVGKAPAQVGHLENIAGQGSPVKVLSSILAVETLNGQRLGAIATSLSAVISIGTLNGQRLGAIATSLAAIASALAALGNASVNQQISAKLDSIFQVLTETLASVKGSKVEPFTPKRIPLGSAAATELHTDEKEPGEPDYATAATTTSGALPSGLSEFFTTIIGQLDTIIGLLGGGGPGLSLEPLAPTGGGPTVGPDSTVEGHYKQKPGPIPGKGMQEPDMSEDEQGHLGFTGPRKVTDEEDKPKTEEKEGEKPGGAGGLFAGIIESAKHVADALDKDERGMILWGEFIETAIGSLGPIFTAFTGWITTTFPGLGGFVVNILSSNAGLAAFAGSLAGILLVVLPLVIALAALLTAVVAVVGAILIVQKTFSFLIDAAKGLIGGIFGAGKALVSGFNDSLGKIAHGDFFGAINSAATGVIKSFDSLTSGILGFIPILGGFADGIIKVFTGALQTAISALTGFASTMIPFVQALSPSTVENYNTQLRNLSATIGLTFQTFIATIADTISKIGGILLPVAEQLAPAFAQLGSLVRTVVLPIVKVFAALLGSLGAMLANSMDRLRSVVVEVVKAFIILAASIARLLGANDFIARLRQAFARPEQTGAIAAGPSSISTFEDIGKTVAQAAVTASMASAGAEDQAGPRIEDMLAAILQQIQVFTPAQIQELLKTTFNNLWSNVIMPQITRMQNDVKAWWGGDAQVALRALFRSWWQDFSIWVERQQWYRQLTSRVAGADAAIDAFNVFRPGFWSHAWRYYTSEIFLPGPF